MTTLFHLTIVTVLAFVLLMTGLVGPALAIAVLAYVVFLPATIAFYRGHHQRWAVLVPTFVCLLLGLMAPLLGFVGLLLALVWSATATQTPRLAANPT